MSNVAVQWGGLVNEGGGEFIGFNHQEGLGDLSKNSFYAVVGARGRLQWAEELVGGTEAEMASVDKFLKKPSCEEKRGTEGDVGAERGFLFPDGRDSSFHK